MVMDVDRALDEGIVIGSSEYMDLVSEGRHPGTRSILRHFHFDHLPEPWRSTSQSCADLALLMVAQNEDGPELVAGLRKLLEAKDCFVRHVVDTRDN